MAKALGCDIYIIEHSDAYTAMGIPFKGARERGAKKAPIEDYYGESDEAQDDVDYLESIGVELTDEKFDENIKRGEAVALLVKYDKAR